MALSFPKTGAKMGVHLNGRVQRHGDEKVSALDVTVGGIMLDDDQFGELMREKLAHRAFFNTRGKIQEPLFKCFDTINLKDEYKKCLVTFYVGLDETAIKITGFSIKTIKVSPKPGGMAEMSCQVQGITSTENCGLIFDNLGRDVSVSMRFGSVDETKKPQPELPLGEGGDDDEPRASGNGGGEGEGAPATH